MARYSAETRERIPVKIRYGGPGDVAFLIGDLNITNHVIEAKIDMSGNGTGLKLTLDVYAPTVEIDGVEVVELAEETRAALVALGWTSPTRRVAHQRGDGATCPNRIDVAPAHGDESEYICGCLPRDTVEAIKNAIINVRIAQPKCSQCGQPWVALACGPTHAMVAAMPVNAPTEPADE